MAAEPDEPPGEGDPNSQRRSYATQLSSNLPTSLKKNVIEVILEKDSKGPFNVSVEDCFKVIVKLGIDPQPGVHLESVQICPNGRGVVFLTFKKEIPIEKFCGHEVIQVTQSGIRAVQIKPAGKRDVVVTIKGLHPNTRDDGVMDYLSKFGKVTSTRVVRSVYSDGPLKGLGNGDRMYKLELRHNSYLGSYHVIDGQRITARYPGQQPTCARCFGMAHSCPGRGMAKRCEQEGGVKRDFNEYILQSWASIGYVPSEVELDSDDENIIQSYDQFTPKKTPVPLQDPSKYAGVRVSSFPKNIDNGLIIEFLIHSGLPACNKDDISIKSNGSVMINNLTNDVCLSLINAIHNKSNFGKRLFHALLQRMRTLQSLYVLIK